MRAQSETIKSSTPLRRIPKNRGTVVRNVSEINPLSEQELKNVIHVYAEANKAYYLNCAKNERNSKKKKKKNNVSKKTESEEFDTHTLNPLNYRNEKFEENGALLHLPGSNVTPNYMSQNPSADYGVSSLAYGTLHKSNPLSWGCDYKKHYELPTICSIVKSKHPIYSRPQNANNGRKNSNISLQNKSKKKSGIKLLAESCQNDKSFTVKKVPTFGNGKEDEIEKLHQDNHKSSAHAFEKNTVVDTTMKDSSYSDKSKDISDGTFNYHGFSDDSEGSSVNNSNIGGLKKVLEACEHNCNFTLKRQDYNEERRNGEHIIQHKKRSKSQHNELNFVNPRKTNGMLNIPSNNSVDIILSNSTIMEMRTSDTESKGAYCSSEKHSGDSSDCLNDSHDYSTPHMGMRRAHNYKDREKRKHKLAAHSSTKGLKTNGKPTKPSALSECKESYYEPYSNVTERSTKKGKVLIRCKVPKPGEKHNPNGCAHVMCENKNNQKLKQSGKYRNNDSSKNGLDQEHNLLDENCCSRGKKKGKTRGLRHGKRVSKYNLQSSSHVKNKKPLNMRAIQPLGCQNGASVGTHNIVASKPTIRETSNVEGCSYVNVKNTPNEKFYARKEIDNLVSGSIPKGLTLTNREKEAHPEGGPVYAYALGADTMPRTPLVTYNMCENVPQAGMKNLSQNVFAEVRPELANVNLCVPEYTARRYPSASLLPNFAAHSVPEGNTPMPKSHLPRAHAQVIHVPLDLSQGRLHLQRAAPQMQRVAAEVHGSGVQTQVPILQTHVPITAALAPYGQADFALKSDSLPQANTPQNQAKMQQMPFIEKPIVLEQIPLANVISSGNIRAADKICSLTELTNQLVSVKGENRGEYTTANALSKPFDRSCNRSHTIVGKNSGDLSKKGCAEEDVFTNSLIKGNGNIDATYTINTSSNKCKDQFKGSDAKVTFSKRDSGMPSWVKACIDTQNTSLKGEDANVGYLNVYTNKINEKTNTNVNSSVGILQCLSNIQSPTNDVYQQPHTAQHVAHKKSVNPEDMSELIKTSNEKFISMQKKQLLDILQEKGDDGLRKTIHTVDSSHHTNGDLNVQSINQVGGEKYQNMLGSTVQYFSYANAVETPKNSAGEMEGQSMKSAERVGNDMGEGNGREFEVKKSEGNHLLLKEGVKVDLHNSNDARLSRGSSTNDPLNIGFTKEKLNLLFYADAERNSLENVDREDGNTTSTSSEQENCPQSDHNNEPGAQCADSNGNAVSADNAEGDDGKFIHVGIGARFREEDHVSDHCANDGICRKTRWPRTIRGESTNNIIDHIWERNCEMNFEKSCEKNCDKTCDEGIDLTNRSDDLPDDSGRTAGRSHGGNTSNVDDVVRVNSANGASDNGEVERGEATNGSTHERNLQDDASKKTYALDGVRGRGLQDLEGNNTRNVIKVMYKERVDKCGLAERTQKGELPELKKEKCSVNHNFDEGRKHNGVVKCVNFNHAFEKPPSFNERMEELKFLKEIYEKEKVDKGKGSDEEANHNFKVSTISGTQNLSVRRNAANLNCPYDKHNTFNREDKVKTFTNAISHLIKNSMEERQKGDDNSFGTLAPTARTWYEPISAIPGSFLEEPKVNKINIKYSHHQDGQKAEGAIKDRSNKERNCGEGVITSKCARDKGKDTKYMSATQRDDPNSEYSFNGKINLSHGGANGEALNNTPQNCLKKFTFAEANPLFEDSKVTYMESPQGSPNGTFVKNKLILNKNRCEIFNPGSIHYGARKETHSVWSGRNLSRGKKKTNKDLHLKESIKGRIICENDGRRVRRRNTAEKRDKYSIHVSDYSSNRNDDYVSYMMSKEGTQNRLASDLPVLPPCDDAKYNDYNYTSTCGNDTKVLRHMGKQFERLEEARLGKPPHIEKLNNDVSFRCSVQSSLNRKSTERENVLGGKVLSSDANDQNCSNTLFCCPVKEVTSAPPMLSRTTTLINKLFRKGKKSAENVDKREKDFKCVDKVPKSSLEETKRDPLLGKCSVTFKEDKSDLFELPTGQKAGRTFSYVSNGTNASRRLCTNCPTIPCEPLKRGRRAATQLYKEQINLPAYAHRTIHDDGNTTTMNNAPPTAMPYPKCELICKIPRRAFTSYFQGRNC
ncbi:hypothetical protein AK88_00432 [Plasmodium fragile]|uniref:Uncharacterized protein n=1 Tax=Plasmodium fragile TaxID=5857 RepID=A0A0D9QU87_PLAFR|nr:uncharacterized protein AK88_00432 [Plasmodium fragile]KJP89976.1 hypothetical protein AK88_00432 [Plasmodium fragile]